MASIYAGQGEFENLDSIVKEMVSLRIPPTVVTFNTIISSCWRNGHGGTTYEWFERMKVDDVVLNEVTYEMLIEALARDGKPRLAYDLHLRVKNEGFELPTKAHRRHASQQRRDHRLRHRKRRRLHLHRHLTHKL